MQQQTIDTAGALMRKYGVWVILGLMGLEIVLAYRRGDL